MCAKPGTGLGISTEVQEVQKNYGLKLRARTVGGGGRSGELAKQATVKKC